MRDEHRRSMAQSSETAFGSAPHLPEFLGAGATPAQLKEFYEVMSLNFGKSDPATAPSGPRCSVGGPSGSAPAALALATDIPCRSALGSALTPVVSSRSFPALVRLSMLRMLVVPTKDILISDDSESNRHWPTLPPSMGLFTPDVRVLNLFLKKEKFKMLTLAQVLSALDPEDWMVALALQDASIFRSCLPTDVTYDSW
ncbi:hypothetical protein NDU88_005017 [Pleurodeles waltl]|uniref:Uncharacterized protein n=1 Tax=Pleurodeles waltl TaxID=8319 RepID=A0AAV7SKH9_PLEWA|nr:hypothetical protein NDU88_005017 [Pleurodeles waltl]